MISYSGSFRCYIYTRVRARAKLTLVVRFLSRGNGNCEKRPIFPAIRGCLTTRILFSSPKPLSLWNYTCLLDSFGDDCSPRYLEVLDGIDFSLRREIGLRARTTLKNFVAFVDRVGDVYASLLCNKDTNDWTRFYWNFDNFLSKRVCKKRKREIERRNSTLQGFLLIINFVIFIILDHSGRFMGWDFMFDYKFSVNIVRWNYFFLYRIVQDKRRSIYIFTLGYYFCLQYLRKDFKNKFTQVEVVQDHLKQNSSCDYPS